MHLQKFSVRNIRSVSALQMEFDKGREAGWHVLLGANGSGKSSIVRSFALLMMGQKEAFAARQVFQSWIGKESDTASIAATIIRDEDFDAISGKGRTPRKRLNATVLLAPVESRGVEPKFGGENVTRTVWGGGEGWFCASFGPFRRFTGGDRIYDKLFISNRRLAPHLTSLGEDVALTEAFDFLDALLTEILRSAEHDQALAQRKLDLVMALVGNTGLLPHGARLSTSQSRVTAIDGRGAEVPLDQLSDGYRSVLSMILELLRQMFSLLAPEAVLSAFEPKLGQLLVPGVVVIDEIDAHLHPDWQREIGRWLTRVFPRVQFIVTTHSPLCCRAVANDAGELVGSIWKLPSPDSLETFRRVEGVELNQLVYGDVLEAYGTELFGEKVTQSAAGIEKVQRLAELNIASLKRALSPEETIERKTLRSIFPGVGVEGA